MSTEPTHSPVAAFAEPGSRCGDSLLRRTVIKLCAAVLAAGTTRTAASRAQEMGASSATKWSVFYGLHADESALSSYDVVVLDPMFQGSIEAIATSGARVCGYLSVGEIRTSDTFYGMLDRAALLEENSAWPGTRRIDVRHPEWKDLVINKIIPSIRKKGFTGLLLDTLDTPPYLEQLDISGKHGMTAAAIDLVRTIRRTNPDLLLIQNRGYAVLPSVVSHIDVVVAESLLTSSDLRGGGTYQWNAPSDIALQLSLLAPARHRQNPLPIFSLDYWDPDDVAVIRRIYSRQRQLGHIPYVATRVLDRLVPEPQRPADSRGQLRNVPMWRLD